MVVSLDDLQEEGGAVLHGLGEDLQQVAVVIKDLESLELGGVGGKKGKYIRSGVFLKVTRSIIGLIHSGNKSNPLFFFRLMASLLLWDKGDISVVSLIFTLLQQRD